MNYTHGIDISAYQHQRGIDWQKLGESKYRVLVCKLSEGLGGSQLELCLEHGEQARRRGWDFSVYHFADKPMRYPAQREAAVFLRLFKQVRHLCSFAPGRASGLSASVWCPSSTRPPGARMSIRWSR